MGPAGAEPCGALRGTAVRAKRRLGPSRNLAVAARSKRRQWHLVGRLKFVFERDLLFGRPPHPVHLQFIRKFITQTIQRHHLGQPGFHPSRPLDTFLPAALAAFSDRQCALESRIVILASKQIDRFLPVAESPALDHYRPPNSCLEPGFPLDSWLVHFSWPPSGFFFRRLSSVRRNRYDSLPVSMMWA